MAVLIASGTAMLLLWRHELLFGSLWLVIGTWELRMGISPRQERRRCGAVNVCATGSAVSDGASGRSFLRLLGLIPFRLDRVGVVVLRKLLPQVMLGDLPPPSLPEGRLEEEE